MESTAGFGLEKLTGLMGWWPGSRAFSTLRFKPFFVSVSAPAALGVSPSCSPLSVFFFVIRYLLCPYRSSRCVMYAPKPTQPCCCRSYTLSNTRLARLVSCLPTLYARPLLSLRHRYVGIWSFYILMGVSNTGSTPYLKKVLVPFQQSRGVSI